jgi:large subunit ribosomal protein L1
VIIDRTKIVSALDAAKEKSVIKMDGQKDKVRKFDEAVDLILNMRDLDIKNPNNRIEQEHMFPHPVHDDRYKVCFFVTGDMEMDIKKRGIAVVDSEALDTLAKTEQR